MTTLLDRYLFAVRSHLSDDLPQDDIIAEIADELESRIAEGADEADVIKAYGHPQVVAARYGRSQYLIGPVFFPFYWSTLRNVLAIGIALVLIGGGIASIVMHDGSVFFDSLGIAWNTAWWIIVVVTVLFAAAERLPEQRVARIAANWDPHDLPVPAALPPVKRFSALAEFIVNFIAVLVLLDAWGGHHIPFDAEVATILANGHASFTGAWYPAYIATLAGAAIIAVSAILVFVRPSLSLLQECVRALAGFVTIGGLAVTLANGPWLVAPDPGWNDAARWCLIAAIVVLLVSVTSSIRNAALAARRVPSPGSLKAGY